MQPHSATVPVSRWRIRAGRVVSGLAVAFLLFDAVIKLMKIPPVVESFTRLGWPDRVALGIGTLELACLAVYLIPRTSVLGAILVTGYLGGAVATHLRVGDPLWTHVLFPVYIGALLWVGLALRDARVLAWVRRTPGSVELRPAA